MTESLPVLELTKVTKAFAGRPVLDELSLQVRPAEILCLLGANGAGKTTTLSVLLGFVQPEAGKVYIDGQEVSDGSSQPRLLLGYLPEVVQLYPMLDAIETLRYFAEMAGEPVPSGDTIEKLLGQVRLENAARHRRVGTYSKGMRQKLALALTLLRQPKALLLDEPLSGLDPQAANDFICDVRHLADTGTAVLMVTHDILRASQVADRIGILRGGKLVALLEARSLDAGAVERIYADHLRDAIA